MWAVCYIRLAGISFSISPISTFMSTLVCFMIAQAEIKKQPENSKLSIVVSARCYMLCYYLFFTANSTCAALDYNNSISCLNNLLLKR